MSKHEADQSTHYQLNRLDLPADEKHVALLSKKQAEYESRLDDWIAELVDRHQLQFQAPEVIVHHLVRADKSFAYLYYSLHLTKQLLEEGAVDPGSWEEMSWLAPAWEDERLAHGEKFSHAWDNLTAYTDTEDGIGYLQEHFQQ